jgi:hypothetical protein
MLFSVGPPGLAIFLIDPGAARFALASGATIFRASGARGINAFTKAVFTTSRSSRLRLLVCFIGS